MNCKISKSQYNTDHQISRSQHFVDQDISRSRYFLGQRRLKALFRLRVETKWKKSLENNYWKYILAVMYTLIASQKNEISFQKLWWYINKTNEFCRSLTKVKFSTDQVRPALGSGGCRWLTMLKNLKTALFQTFSTWHRILSAFTAF